jgi:CheY-like chemotaxis protein
MDNLVYIVDDDPDDRQIILQSFNEHHAQIDCVLFENAQEVLDRLKTGSSDLPALILLDLNMPGITGLQALREIRQDKKFTQVPVVVLTTSRLRKDRSTSYEYGANCFLTKPDSYSKLLAIVGAVIKLWISEGSST